MIQAPTSSPPEGGRPTARAGWRLFARLLALLALAFLVVAPATSCAEASTANVAGITAPVGAADAGAPDPAHSGQAEHCAHCGCHGTARLGLDAALPPLAQTPVCFTTRQQNGPRRTTAPLLEPPRA